MAWLVRPKTDDVPAADTRDAAGFGVFRGATAAAGSSAAAGCVAKSSLVRARAAVKQAASFASEQRAAGEIDVLHQERSVTRSELPDERQACNASGQTAGGTTETDPLCTRLQLGSKPQALLTSRAQREKSSRCTKRFQ